MLRTDAARQVTLAMIVAGLTYGAAAGLEFVADERDAKRIDNPLPKLGGWEALIAWGAVFLFLTIMADIPATGALAVSFAWLFVLAVLFTYGIEAFTNVQSLTGNIADGDPPTNIPPPSGLGPI